jgi:succinyl-diaminopimelate desuccinylase
MDKRIIHYVEHQQDAMTNFLGDLIRIQTVNPPGKDYLDCVRFLHQRLEALGFTSRILEVPDREVQRHHPENARYPRFNVLANWDVGAKKTLHFNAHYDVVPVSGKWRGKPFSGSLHGGQVHGRGSADMKGSIASFLHAMEAFRSARLSPAFNIEVSFVCDEETGGHLGTQFLTQN